MLKLDKGKQIMHLIINSLYSLPCFPLEQFSTTALMLILSPKLIFAYTYLLT